MATRSTGPDNAPLIVIVGETGSGKTALAIALAKQFDGEIICADSRTVYTGMDIGTAKPSREEQAGIPHYGLDVVEPGQVFTAYDFQQLANTAIADINERGKLPIVVGGTGLYVDALIYGFQFRKPASSAERAALDDLSVAELQQRIVDQGYDLPENAVNRRHLTRLLESGPPPRQPRVLRPNTLVLGLRLPKDELTARIALRVTTMFGAGLVTEVRELMTRYGSVEALKAPGYSAVAAYLAGKLTLDGAKQQFVRDDLKLAKRQRTWFRRNQDIQWLTDMDQFAQAGALVAHFLKQ